MPLRGTLDRLQFKDEHIDAKADQAKDLLAQGAQKL